MTPVDQRVIASTPEAPGDCLSACVASVLDLPLDEVPLFAAMPDWLGAFTRWLDARGLALVYLAFGKDEWPWLPPRDLPLIVGGQSPRGPWGHAVIGIWRDGAMEVLHDPHPSRAGILGDPTRVYLLVPRGVA